MAYMCKGFSHFSGFLHGFVLAKLASSSSIRVRMYAKWHAAAGWVAASARAVAGWVAVREGERCAFEQHTQGRRPEYCGGGRDED